MAFLLLVGFVIGFIKLKKEQKKKEKEKKIDEKNLSKDTELYTFLVLMFAVFLFSFASIPGITGFVVYGPGLESFGSSLSMLGAIAVLFVLLLLVVHRREPFRKT